MNATGFISDDGKYISAVDRDSLMLSNGWTYECRYLSTPDRFFSGPGGMYLETYISGSYAYVKRRTYGGSEGTNIVINTDVNKYCGVYAFTVGDDPTNNAYYRVVWYIGSSASTILDEIRANHYTSDNVLFEGSLADAKAAGVATDLREWDETPEMDPENPDNTSPIGGEDADRMDFDAGDDVEFTDWPSPLSIDPYGEATTDPSKPFNTSLFCPYLMTQAQFKLFGRSMFEENDGWFWKFLNSGTPDPDSMGILKLFSLPVNVPAGADSVVYLLGKQLPNVGGAVPSAKHINGRYINHDFNSITIKEVWGTEKDYTDTSIDIYLPYVGVRSVDPVHVIGHTLKLKVRIDIWTGDLLYMLQNDNADVSGKYFREATIPYRWAGNCAANLPYATKNDSNMRGALQSSILGVGATLAMIPFAREAAAPAMMAQAGIQTAQGAGRMIEAHKSGPVTQTSGSLDGLTGIMDYPVPYLIVTRAVPQYPLGWRSRIGAKRHQSYTINELSGFTLFSEVKLGSMGNATDEEIEELKRLICSEGIIL